MADERLRVHRLARSETQHQSADECINDLLKLSNKLWVQLLDYEKVVQQILKLEEWINKHQAKPIHYVNPGHNFSLSVGEGVKGMYDNYRQRQWKLVKNTIHQIETHSRLYQGLNIQLNISTDHGELPLPEEHDWTSLYWLCADRELSRAP